MGFMANVRKFVSEVSGERGIPIVEANVGGSLDHEWLRGRFSSMVVGESHYVEGFVNAYSPLVWPEGTKRTQREVRDMVVVELRRDPGNKYDPNAIGVWCLGSPRSPHSWLGGFLKREVAARVAPVVDEHRLSSWRHPAELRGKVSLRTPTFGISLLPGRLLTRGPDMSGLLKPLDVGYRPATEKQIDFVLSLLGQAREIDGLVVSTQVSKREMAAQLARVGNPPNWKSRATWQTLDSHQISIAIDVLQGNALWAQD